MGVVRGDPGDTHTYDTTSASIVPSNDMTERGSTSAIHVDMGPTVVVMR
jgi:hypothetical protein